MLRQVVETITERNHSTIFDQRVNDYLVAGWELHGPPTHAYLLMEVRMGDSALNYRKVAEVQEVHTQTMVKNYKEDEG